MHGYGSRVKVMISSRRVEDIREGLQGTVSATMAEK